MTASGQNQGWQIASVSGHMAGQGIDQWFEQGFVAMDAPKAPTTPVPRLSPEYLMPHVATDHPVWVVLPAGEQYHRDQWQSGFGRGRIQLGFGRAGLALAMGSIHRYGIPTQILAADCTSGVQWLSLMLTPGPGPKVGFSTLDGRIGGTDELGSLLEKAQAATPDIGVLVCPGRPQGRAMERLMPFLGSLSRWNRPHLRWEFPEQMLPVAGVAGGLWGLYWLLDGYRVGDWYQPGALLLLDEDSPLAGIITLAQDHKRGLGRITTGPALAAVGGNREVSV